MENNLAYQWYFAPVWAINAIGMGRYAYRGFKEMRENNLKILPALVFSVASACSIGLTGFCVADGLEKIIK